MQKSSVKGHQVLKSDNRRELNLKYLQGRISEKSYRHIGGGGGGGGGGGASELKRSITKKEKEVTEPWTREALVKGSRKHSCHYQRKEGGAEKAAWEVKKKGEGNPRYRIIGVNTDAGAKTARRGFR